MSKDTPKGDIALLLSQAQDSADIMHTWSRKLYRQADELRRLAAGHKKLVERLTIETGNGYAHDTTENH